MWKTIYYFQDEYLQICWAQQVDPNLFLEHWIRVHTLHQFVRRHVGKPDRAHHGGKSGHSSVPVRGDPRHGCLEDLKFTLQVIEIWYDDAVNIIWAANLIKNQIWI